LQEEYFVPNLVLFVAKGHFVELQIEEAAPTDDLVNDGIPKFEEDESYVVRI
jgi:hypothetical protein